MRERRSMTGRAGVRSACRRGRRRRAGL